MAGRTAYCVRMRSAIIEEIKTTELPLSLLSGQPDTPGYNPLHWAQAKCYAFILSQQEKLDAVEVRLIYCQVETEELQQFTARFAVQELESFYLDLLRRYHRWAQLRADWSVLRNQQALALPFPFASYREGQRADGSGNLPRSRFRFTRVLSGPYRHRQDHLLPLPRGQGDGGSKSSPTSSTSPPRPLPARWPKKGFALMQQKGMRLKRVTLTAKDKICFLEERLCNPDDCPYARGLLRPGAGCPV